MKTKKWASKLSVSNLNCKRHRLWKKRVSSRKRSKNWKSSKRTSNSLGVRFTISSRNTNNSSTTPKKNTSKSNYQKPSLSKPDKRRLIKSNSFLTGTPNWKLTIKLWLNKIGSKPKSCSSHFYMSFKIKLRISMRRHRFSENPMNGSKTSHKSSKRPRNNSRPIQTCRLCKTRLHKCKNRWEIIIISRTIWDRNLRSSQPIWCLLNNRRVNKWCLKMSCSSL